MNKRNFGGFGVADRGVGSRFCDRKGSDGSGGDRLAELSQSGVHGKARLIYMKAEELDRKFDDGEEVLEYFDLSLIKRPGLEMSPVEKREERRKKREKRRKKREERRSL
jgi:hypothetical protein